MRSSVSVGVKRITMLLDINVAVFWGLVARVWQIASGPLTMLMIAYFYSREMQGYYYTFASMLSLQVFLELGLTTVIVRFASHEWAQLAIDSEGRIVGDASAKSRLASLARLGCRWFGVAAVLLGVGLAIGGNIFFTTSEREVGVHWQGPWLALAGLTALQLIFDPLWALLQGCNQMAQVNFFRFVSGMIRSIVLWLSIWMGMELWAVPLTAFGVILWTLLYLTKKYATFFSSIRAVRICEEIEWKAELWPMQWRIALSWLSGFFIINFMMPVVFYFQGPVVAGQLGISLSLVGVIISISTVWINVKIPEFGMLIAKRLYKELDQLALRVGLITVSVDCIIAALIVIFVYGVEIYVPHLASRLLPIWPIAMLAFTNVVIAISNIEADYLRAHRKEPLMPVSVASAFGIAVCTIITAKYMDVTWVIAGFMLISIISALVVTYLLFSLRAKWHAA